MDISVRSNSTSKMAWELAAARCLSDLAPDTSPVVVPGNTLWVVIAASLLSGDGPLTSLQAQFAG
jgi:hypothetical protein